MSRRVGIDPINTHELEFFSFGQAGAGPRVLITAGIHGGEATGIWAARQLTAWLGEAAGPLQGQVTVLPVANPTAFRKLTRYSPFDEMDLNRIFPGNPEGSHSQRLASTIWAEAVQADFLIDLHCCGLFGSDYTLALWQEFAAARELSAKIDIPVVIQSGGTRNQLFTEASHAGIPAVILELAGGQLGLGGGILDRASGERAVRSVQNLLRRLGVAAGEAPAISPRFYGKLQGVPASSAGLWSPVITPGATVAEGQLVGRLEQDPIYAPFSGVATAVRGESYVFPGHTLSMMAPALEQA